MILKRVIFFLLTTSLSCEASPEIKVFNTVGLFACKSQEINVRISNFTILSSNTYSCHEQYVEAKFVYRLSGSNSDTTASIFLTGGSGCIAEAQLHSPKGICPTIRM